MSEQHVIELMKSSKTSAEWNANCSTVKRAFNNDYPSFWYKAIVMSGVASETGAQFGESADIQVLAGK